MLSGWLTILPTPIPPPSWRVTSNEFSEACRAVDRIHPVIRYHRPKAYSLHSLLRVPVDGVCEAREDRVPRSRPRVRAERSGLRHGTRTLHYASRLGKTSCFCHYMRWRATRICRRSNLFCIVRDHLDTKSADVASRWAIKISKRRKATGIPGGDLGSCGNYLSCRGIIIVIVPKNNAEHLEDACDIADLVFCGRYVDIEIVAGSTLGVGEPLYLG